LDQPSRTTGALNHGFFVRFQRPFTSIGHSTTASRAGMLLVLYLGIPTALAAVLVRWPLSTGAAVATCVVAALSVLSARKTARLVAGLLLCLLTGYAFFGKSFAYLGIPPVYVGEAVLGFALVGSLGTGLIWFPLRSKLAWLLLSFAALCAAQTIPYIPVYGLDALRDAALWGYAAFAFVVAGLLLRQWPLAAAAGFYRRLMPALLIWIVVAWGVQMFAPSLWPVLEPDGSPAFLVKAGDATVHLAGIASFLILGLHRVSPRKNAGGGIREWFLWTIWGSGFVLLGSQTRGGLLSMLVGLSMVLVLRPRGKWGKLAVVCLCGLSLFLVLDLEFDIGKARSVSPQQILNGLTSVTGGGDPRYEGTRRWRLSWWQTIIEYTFHGQFFWSGKGFGVNLADDDGYQADAYRRLRSPHNGHLTILARAGVPGLAIWLLVQGCFCLGLFKSYVRARGTGQGERAALVAWILSYWAAFMVNGAFDVFLEGPQGGIWYWSVFGVGLAVLSERSPCSHRRTRTTAALLNPASSVRAA